jgi:ferredoxin--NADP+ reductase
MLRTRIRKSIPSRPSDSPLRLRLVQGLAEVSAGVYLLSVSPAGPFQPGQTVALGLEEAGPSRFYSIASGADEARTDVLFDLVPGGVLTPHLTALGPGDPVYLSSPFGAFVDEDGPTVWIATGTGVAPFASMARSMGAKRCGEKTLVHGSRTPSALHFGGLMAEALGPRYHPCCSTGEAAGVFHGRVTDWLSEHELPVSSRYMLCGGSAMVVDVRDLLLSRGVPLERIAAEIYF